MSFMESDLRRMIGNAKSFNQKSSPVFSDAEKMRKAVVAFMTENNPAYKTGNYVPGPTPIPEGWQAQLEEADETADADAEGETVHEETPPRPEPPSPPAASARKQRSAAARSASVNAAKDRRASSTPAVQDAEGAGESFDGDNFQQAQEKIITEMINLKNDESVPSLPRCTCRTNTNHVEMSSSVGHSLIFRRVS